MIDPELTKVLGRRILASLVNLLLVGAASLAFIAAQAERFVITQRNAEGNPVWPRYSGEGRRLAELDDTFNRALTVGDNFYVWHTPALFVSGLIITLISLVVWVLVPASVGWSPGHRLLGLKVVTMDGQDPPLDGYLRRYVVGLLDLFPFVIPGLLGWLTASRNEHSQRIGDLSGDTVVVDANAEIRMIDATAYANRTSQMVDVGDAIADHRPKKGSGFSPEQVVAEAEAAQASPWNAPVVETEKQELYIPTHHDATVASDATADQSGAVASTEPEAAEASESEVTWSQPVSEPAPVWEPESLDGSQTTDAASEVTEVAEPEMAHAMADATPSSGDGTQASEAAPAAVATASAANASVAAAAASSAPGEGTPTWSDDWQAWLFWDHVNQRWLRHVEDDDSWLPIN